MSEIMSLFIFNFKSRLHHRTLSDPKSETDSMVLSSGMRIFSTEYLPYFPLIPVFRFPH